MSVATSKFARTIQVLLIPLWLWVISHWGWEILRGVPDDYPGQRHAGIFLASGGLVGTITSFLPHSRLKIALILLMWALLIPALYFAFRH